MAAKKTSSPKKKAPVKTAKKAVKKAAAAPVKKKKAAPKKKKTAVEAVVIEQAKPSVTRDDIVHAALSLATLMPWDMVTLSDIADEAGLSLAELSVLVEDKSDILVAYGRMVDRIVLESCGEADPSVSEKDRLFEIFMERFDVLNDERAAVLSILKSFTPDPKQAIISLPHLAKSMAWMLEAAGLDTFGLKGALRLAGLTGVYLLCVRTWMKDESEDLSETMAAVDKNLSRAQQFAGYLSL